MQLSSPAFREGGRLPHKYTIDGCNTSPPVHWHNVPQRAAELVLVLEHVDAPNDDPFVHWLVYKIPADSHGLPGALPPQDELTNPPGAMHGATDFPNQRIGYHGPAPRPEHEHGRHTYRFHLYALDEPMPLPPGEPKPRLMELMKGHVLAEALLVVHYERQGQRIA